MDEFIISCHESLYIFYMSFVFFFCSLYSIQDAVFCVDYFANIFVSLFFFASFCNSSKWTLIEMSKHFLLGNNISINYDFASWRPISLRLYTIMKWLYKKVSNKPLPFKTNPYEWNIKFVSKFNSSKELETRRCCSEPKIYDGTHSDFMVMLHIFSANTQNKKLIKIWNIYTLRSR